MNTSKDYCGVERDPRGVVQLTIRNAGPLNILNSSVIDGIHRAIKTLAKDDGIRVVVLRGEGEKAFIGGADIKELAMLTQPTGETFISALRDLCEDLRHFPAPVIARIPGFCLGGGLEFAAACDFRIASSNAKFAMPEVKVGIPSVIHAALLPRLIGIGRARWLVMTAATIDAKTALDWGLLDAIAEPADLDAEVEALVAMLLGCGQEALRAQKVLVREWEELPLQDAIANSVKIFGRSFLTDEPQRHMQAFINRKR